MNKVSVRFKSDVKNVALARNIASAFILEKDPTVSLINEVKTIVSEAVTNAIVHGYDSDDSFEVSMNLEINDNELSIEVVDYGMGIIDIEQAKTPLYSTKSDVERSGLGFTIIEVFSDTLHITSLEGLGTTIHATKKLCE
ncbi:MAG: anti-sigma F factor [bacterium]